MLESHIRQLKSQEVLERRQAVVKITNSGHPEALAVLEKFLRTEKDTEIRTLTEKAIQYLKTNKPAGVAAVGTTTSQRQPTVAASQKNASGVFLTEKHAAPAPLGHSAPAAHAVPMGQLIPPRPISEQQKKLAKGKLDSAMQFQMNGKGEEALLALKRAIELNPDLERDSFAFGLASALTGGGGDPMALVKAASKTSGTEAKKLVVQGATTMLDFGIEMAIITIVFIAYFAIANRQFQAIGEALVQYARTTGVSSASLDALASFTNTSRQQLLISALTQGAGLTVSGLVQAFLMYITGILLGGTGNLLDFLRAIMRVTAGIYLALGAVFLIFPAASWLPFDPVTRQPPAFSPFIALMVIALVGGILWVYFAGRAHGFGFFKGCAMIVLTSIGFSILLTIVFMLAGPRMPTDLPGMIMPLLSLR
jgi:hypothetical protein